MVFSSLKFIFIFLPVFLLAYSASEKKYRNAVLLVSSLIVGIVMFYVMGLLRPLPILIYLATVIWVLYESNTANEKRFRCVVVVIAAA